MYEVVVVDDKPLICKSLEQTIPWETYACSVVGTAYDGLQAKALIDQYHPDLVITDIKMPGMDGLELTEYIHKKLPDTQVIIITGYQEFEYARKAIQLGVVDLVVKPISNDDMEKVIQKAVTKIEEEKERKCQKIDSERFLRTRMISDLLYQRVQDKNSSEFQNLKKSINDYYIVLGHIRRQDSNINAEITDEIIRILKEEKKVDFFNLLLPEHLFLLIPVDGNTSMRENKIHVKQMLENIQQKIGEKFGEESKICFVVSQQGKGIMGVRELYENARQVLEECLFVSEDNLVFVKNSQFYCRTTEGNLIEGLEELYKKLDYEPEEKELHQLIKHILNMIQVMSGGNIFKMKCLISEICITILRKYSNTFSEGKRIEEYIDQAIGEVNQLTDLKQAEAYLKLFLQNIREGIKNSRKLENPIAQNAVIYIQQHYRENFSLADLADHLKVNASYLSRLLKKETGKNFVDLLSSARITVAKRLLAEPGNRVTEVGEQVGCRDYVYFYQVFKRLEGVSPSEYIKSVKKTNI